MVEVDCHTGDSSVLLADLVVDVGRSLNPGIDVGQVEGAFFEFFFFYSLFFLLSLSQVEGAFVQGQGYATNEQILLSPESGEVLTSGAGSYKVTMLVI